VQKYNFFFNWQAFLKKKIYFFSLPFFKVFFSFAMIAIPLGLGGQRYYLFPLSCKSFFAFF